MDFPNRRCGACGTRGFSQKNVKGIWKKPWKDFSAVPVNRDHFIWACNQCGEEASSGSLSLAKETDDLIELSLREHAVAFFKKYPDLQGEDFDVHDDYLNAIKDGTHIPPASFWKKLRNTELREQIKELYGYSEPAPAPKPVDVIVFNTDLDFVRHKLKDTNARVSLVPDSSQVLFQSAADNLATIAGELLSQLPWPARYAAQHELDTAVIVFREAQSECSSK